MGKPTVLNAQVIMYLLSYERNSIIWNMSKYDEQYLLITCYVMFYVLQSKKIYYEETLHVFFSCMCICVCNIIYWFQI